MVCAVHVTAVAWNRRRPDTCMICGAVVLASTHTCNTSNGKDIQALLLITSCAVADSPLPSISKQQRDRLRFATGTHFSNKVTRRQLC
jgi:hypothetical protein